MRTRVWIALAFFVLFFIACVWPKPTMEEKPVPVVPELEHETIFSAFAKGVNDGIGEFVREDLWKRTEEKRSAPRQD